MLDDGPKSHDWNEHFGCKLYTFPLSQSLAKSNKIELATIKMRQKFMLMSSDEASTEKLLSYESQFSIKEADREYFLSK